MICEVLAVIVALGYLLLGDSTCRVVSLSAGSGAWSIVRLVIFPFFEPNPLMAVIAIGVLLAFGRPLERVMTGRITMAQLLPTTCVVTGLILLVWCFLFHGGGAEGVPSTQYLGPVPLIMAVLVARCRFDSQSRSSLANDHLVSLAVLAALILDVVNHVAGATLLRCTEAPVGSVFLTAGISMWVAWAGIRLSQREDDESFPFVDLLPRELMRLIPPMDRMKKARQTARRSRQFGGNLPSPAFAATNSNAPALPLEESSADDAARRSAIALKALEQVIKRQQQPTSEGTTDV